MYEDRETIYIPQKRPLLGLHAMIQAKHRASLERLVGFDVACWDVRTDVVRLRRSECLHAGPEHKQTGYR